MSYLVKCVSSQDMGMLHAEYGVHVSSVWEGLVRRDYLFDHSLPPLLQGSAKLEKAEILQMTVDHLRHLHSRDPRGKSFVSICGKTPGKACPPLCLENSPRLGLISL